MRICFVSPEVFSWGYHGGFGFLTRTLGKELVRRGHEVSVVTVRRGSQGEVEELDGMKILGFPSHSRGNPRAISALLSRRDSLELYRKADAEIYHSEEVSYNTVAAQLAMPSRSHVITFQDPYDRREWERISKVEPKYKLTSTLKVRLALENKILSKACERADVLYSQAHFLKRRSSKLFGLKRLPGFLPNPVEVPTRAMRKSGTPTVCFLTRWDPQKRAEIFFELARKFPEIDFIAMGRSHDPLKDAKLRKENSETLNLKLVGFVSEEEKSRILEKSWALVNTSVREALPISFLEALAHETPIISGENPDGLTARYSYHVKEEDYIGALLTLLRDDSWRDKGRRGRRHVERVHDLDRVVDMHIEAYRALLERRR